MRKTVFLDKPIGQTPLEAIEAWKLLHPEYAKVPASYAGRLDPMASGKLLVLLGEECKKKDAYTKLDKVYEIEVLLDVGSDTGDILGIIESVAAVSSPTKQQLEKVLKKEVGTQTLPYPAYSSKTVAGKPLFLYALEGLLDTIQIPTHPETIYDAKVLSYMKVSRDELRARLEKLLMLAPRSDKPSKTLGADFRITPVRASWEAVLEKERSYGVIRLRVSCASGAYMRSLAGRIGESLGIKALALSIHRTRIGKRNWFWR